MKQVNVFKSYFLLNFTLLQMDADWEICWNLFVTHRAVVPPASPSCLQVRFAAAVRVVMVKKTNRRIDNPWLGLVSAVNQIRNISMLHVLHSMVLMHTVVEKIVHLNTETYMLCVNSCIDATVRVDESYYGEKWAHFDSYNPLTSVNPLQKWV